MSLLDKASLIVTPNAYKESKLYSVVPSSGAGDMDVVRATTATRVNSAGLIEVVPRNLLTYSEDFTNAAWQKRANITIEANSIAAPNGTITASKLKVTDNANVDYGCFQIVTSGTNRTLSVYAKKAELNYLFLGFNNDTANEGVFFDLNNGTISRNTGSFTASIQDIGDGWYRCSALFTTISYCFISPSVTGTSFLFNTQINKGIYIWGSQLETSSTATEYFPTTTRLNIPRIDYTNGSCPSLLVEPQRTNLATYSEQFENADWSKYIGSVTANAITSPSGILNADKFIDSTDNDIHALYKAFTISGDTTFSFYVKVAEYSKIAFYNLSDGGLAKFNISNGTIISTDSNWKNSTIQNIGNGWYRISSTTNGVSGAKAIGVALLNNSNQEIFAGTGTSGIYLWGAQVEAGAYPTSYIPTVASSVTRNADVISKTGISSLIGQTEGTIFVDAYRTNKSVNYQAILGLGNGSSSSEMMEFFFRADNQLTVGVYNSGQQFVSNTGILSGRHKIALAYKLNDFALYIDGALITSDNSGTVPTMNKINIGGFNYTSDYEYADGINSVQLYKTRLSNTELAQLTTL